MRYPELMQRKPLALATATMLALCATFLTAPQTASASMLKPANVSAKNAVGLILKFSRGIHAKAPDGNVTGQNSAGVRLTKLHGLGHGLYATAFANKLNESQALFALQNIQTDPRVQSAEFDYRVPYQAQSLSKTKAPAKVTAKTVVIKPATLVQSLTITNSWNASTPLVPKITLSWKAPKTLNGAKLVGYRIDNSTNGTTFTVWNANTKSTARSLLVTSGIYAGMQQYWRVRAITKVGTKLLTGAASKTVAFTPSTAPEAPKFYAKNVVFSGESVQWIAQTAAQRGGLPVTYNVTAVDHSGNAVSCTTISNSCSPSGMSSGVAYTASVEVKNSLGTATSLQVADPMYGSQWYLYSTFGIQADRAWEITQGAATIVVAVIDTGLTVHPDLAGQTVPGYDFIYSDQSSQDNQSDGLNGSWDSDPSDPGDYTQDYTSSWHGTHVAGIIAAAKNSIGVVGVAPNVKIEPIRVLGSGANESAYQQTSDLIAAINWATGVKVPGVPLNANPARVMNLSLGTSNPSGCDTETQGAFRTAWDKGVVAVTAAGNMQMEAAYSYPGNCFPTINVGATSVSGNQSYYSNYGPGVDFSAPGGDDSDATGPATESQGMMLSTWNLGQTSPGAADYGLEEGTSMAAPVVAGVVALIFSLRPELTSDDVYNVIKKTVRPFASGTTCAQTASQYGTQNGNSQCGAGIVDAAAAVKLALTFKTGTKY